MATPDFWFRCPGSCGALGSIDNDQARGRVSIDCPRCEFHKTGIIAPLIPATNVVTRSQTFTFTERNR